MDHKTAETLQSVDKYLLNELSSGERTEFEEHMFDCPLCSGDVRQNFTVMENLKEVLREEKARAISLESSRAGRRGWFSLPSLAPTSAALALACVLGYQDFGPRASETARVLPAAAVLSTSATRGPDSAILVDRKLPSFLLKLTVDDEPGVFECEFKNAAGKQLLPVLKTPPESTAAFDLQLELPTKTFPAGAYELSLRPATEPDRIKTYRFVIQDSR